MIKIYIYCVYEIYEFYVFYAVNLLGCFMQANQANQTDNSEAEPMPKGKEVKAVVTGPSHFEAGQRLENLNLFSEKKMDPFSPTW